MTAVVTIWTGPLDGCLLAESARRFDIPLVVTQQGRPWVNWSHNKVDVFHAGVRSLPFERLCYVDGDDAVFVRPDALAVAGAALAACGRDFLVGGEVLCWPWPARHAPRYATPDRLRYPNAGCWIATRAGFEREFRTMLAAKAADDGYAEDGHTRQNDDQAMFHEAVLAGTMAVDAAARLVLNLNELGLSDAAALRRIIGTDGPAILHGSGRAKGQVRRVWSRLGRLIELADVPRYDPVETDPLSRAINSTRGLQDMLRELPALGRVAEVGCFRGVSTEVFALLAAEVVAVDCWGDEDRALPDFRRMADRNPNVSVVRERSPGAAERFPDGHFDLVYVDGDHRYEAVRADLLAWLPKVRPGGWIAGHDYTDRFGLDGVVRAVDEVLGEPEKVFSDRSWYVRRSANAPARAAQPARPARAPALAPTLSVIVPTVGRESLARALASIKAQGDLTGVEVIVAVDGDHPTAHTTFLAAGLPGFSVGLPGPHRDWGHTPSNLVTPLARNAYLLRLDDDNVYDPGAFARVRAALAENLGRPHVFRIRRGPPWDDVLWTDPTVRPGNVDTQMFVVPNDPNARARWGRRYEGDFDFIATVGAAYPPGAVVWRPEVIGTWRPAPDGG